MSNVAITASSDNKKTNLFLVLTGIFLTNAILAELIGVKVFSAEAIFGIEPVQLRILNDSFSFNLTAGVIIWPVVFITTDVINEYFGREGVKKISFLTVGLISYIFLMIFIVTKLPPAAYWLEVNKTDAAGNEFNINFAFNKVYTQGLGIIIGSLFAFLISQLLDVFIFQKLRRITKGKKIWLRATGSTLVSQFVDSFVVLTIAFYLFGNWSLNQVISIGILNYIYKFFVAILVTPIIYLAHYFIDRYLGKDTAHMMAEKASQNKSFF